MAECRSETSFDSYTFSFEWTVNDLYARLHNPCKLTSPEFNLPAGSEPPTKWQLAVFLHPDERSQMQNQPEGTSEIVSRSTAARLPQDSNHSLGVSAPIFTRPSVEQFIGVEVKRRPVSYSYIITTSGVQNKKQVDPDEEGIWSEAKLQPPKVNKKSSSAGKEVVSSLGPMKLSVSSTSSSAVSHAYSTGRTDAVAVVDSMFFKHVLPLSEVQNSHSVVFNCQITVWSLDSPKHEKHTSLQPTALGAPEFNLSKIMEEARKNGHFTDVTLVVAGGKEFKAHKVILATQSQFFKTKFESRWSSGAGQQHCNNRIEMTDVPANVMEAVLSYMYTGAVTNGIDGIAMETLATAEEYGLEGLRRMCEASLAKTLTSESVIDMLIFADNHNAVDLRKECMKYISSNASIVRNSEGWKKLNDPNIYQRFGFEILEAIAKRV